MTSTADIDRAVLELITQGSHSNLTIGSRLESRYRLNGSQLPCIIKKVNHPAWLWNAQEHANRACQQPRKRGLIRYDARTGWSRTEEAK